MGFTCRGDGEIKVGHAGTANGDRRTAMAVLDDATADKGQMGVTIAVNCDRGVGTYAY